VRAVTRDISWRKPRGPDRSTRRRRGETGLVVHGWYQPVRGWNAAVNWNAITVRVDGRPRVVVHQFKNGPLWIALASGVHFVEFLGGRKQLHTEWLKVARGESYMITFKPRERRPFRARTTADQWSLRELW
jgi:hypothetical protein